VQRATSQDIWLRFQTAPEMEEALRVCLDPSRAKTVKLSNWVVVCLALAITGLSIFAFVHFADISKDRSRLEQELKTIKRNGSSKDKELEILRTYASADKETSEGHQAGMQLQSGSASGAGSGLSADFGTGIGTLGQALSSGSNRSAVMTTAFKEMDEETLSDKDGVPLESQIPTFDNDSTQSSGAQQFGSQSSSSQSTPGAAPQTYGQPDHTIRF
jgi:hypothetical protein